MIERRPKHVADLGRWRIAWRFGRYRTGLKVHDPAHFTFGLPFLWLRAIRRDADPKEGK